MKSLKSLKFDAVCGMLIFGCGQHIFLRKSSEKLGYKVMLSCRSGVSDNNNNNSACGFVLVG